MPGLADTYVARLTPTQFVVRVHPELISDRRTQAAHVAVSTCSRYRRVECVVVPYLCKIERSFRGNLILGSISEISTAGHSCRRCRRFSCSRYYTNLHFYAQNRYKLNHLLILYLPDSVLYSIMY